MIEAEAMASLRSEVHLECPRSSGTQKDNRNIGPQTEAILLVFYDIPCFFFTDGTQSFPGIRIAQPQRRWSFNQNGGGKNAC
jgi:hypothetical protein